MYKTVEEKTVDEQLLDAYKAQVSTYVRLLEVKDAQVALLKTHIEGLEKELEQCRVKHQSSTGLTTKEREEIAKLSKEIMDESLEGNEWPEEMTIEIEFEDFDKVLRGAITRAFGIAVESKENTTTANSDVDLSKELHDLSLPIIQWLRKNHNPHKAVIITVDHSKIVEDQIGIPFN